MRIIVASARRALFVCRNVDPSRYPAYQDTDGSLRRCGRYRLLRQIVAPAQLALPGAVAQKGACDLPMQDQRSCTDVGATDDCVESVVLTLLLESKTAGPWSVPELARELGGELQATDAIARLHAAGLVHRCHEFVWATRSATRFHQLVGRGLTRRGECSCRPASARDRAR
jgi:hypothetical protein